MDFPKEKMEIVTSHGGKTSEKGWLVLKLGTLDLEGVSKIYVDLDAVEELQRQGAVPSDVLKRTRSLLGGD